MNKSETTPLKKSDQPAISVILCNYNYSHFIGQAIDGVLQQTFGDFELIIVDDGSTDNSRSVIESYTDDRIVRIFKENEGQASAFNAGFSESSGEVISFIDSDDWWLPEKLYRIMQWHQFLHGNYAVLQHTMDIWDAGKLYPYKEILPVGDCFQEMARTGRIDFFIPTSGLCFPRIVLEKIFPIPNKFRIASDAYITRTAISFGDVYSIPETLGIYRRHNNAVFQNDQFKTEQFFSDLLFPHLNNFYRENGLSCRLPVEDFSLATRFSELGLLASHSFRSERPILVDVGAHRGAFSRRFADRHWCIVAFEPEQKNFASLVKNLQNCTRANLQQKAVSDVTGEYVPFYVSKDHYGIHSLTPFHDSHHYLYDVETIRLDDALNELEINKVTLLKIDIEGADFPALKSFNFDQYTPELIMVEFMDERSQAGFGYDHHDMVFFMRDKGYIAYVSEWAAIDEYARENSPTAPHVWLQCVPYPLNHNPAWGNLIFIRASDEEKFRKTLSAYLDELERQAEYSKTILGLTKSQLKKYGAKIPGAKSIYRRVLR